MTPFIKPCTPEGRMLIDYSFNRTGPRQSSLPCMRPGGCVLTEKALEICGLPPGSLIADIGCGAGETLELLGKTGLYHAVGVDYSEILLQEATPRLVSGHIVQASADSLPFKQKVFDAVFCECVLSVLPDRRRALLEFAGVLKQGGFLILSDVFARDCPGPGSPENRSQETWGKGFILKEELLSFLTGLGFSMLLWEDHERFLKEFAASMILAGERFPEPWGCFQLPEGKRPCRTGISYFLLVAMKQEDSFNQL
jgi:arsenite methyltransferase